MMKPKQIDPNEWLFHGCFIQESVYRNTDGKYLVFKNNEEEEHVGRCHTFTEAKRLCVENKCEENHVIF